MIMTISFSAPAGAAVSSIDIAGVCDIVAAEDDKKPGGEKEEPDCE